MHKQQGKLLKIHNGIIPAEFVADAKPTQRLAGALSGFTVASIEISAGRIRTVGSDLPASSLATLSSSLDASGCVILPGFIDVHVHGSVGHDTMDATPEALSEFARFFAQHGVTAFLPTTMTAPHHNILRAVQAVAQQPTLPPDGARCLGVHLEGPYLSPKYPGAQPATYIRRPNLAEFRALLAAGPVRMITLAPEEPGAAELIAEALRHNVKVVLGHTNASYEECEAAIAAGVSQATHTYNAMSPLHQRRPGTLGAVLSNDAIYAQLIADNFHVHPAAMKILARCKGVQRTILITDAIRATAMPDGKYDLGGQMVTVTEGQCRLPDGTLAGSTLTMEQGLRNFMAATDLSLAEAWPASSRTAAQALGVAHEFGALVPGYHADLVLLDEQLQVIGTIVAGRVVYLREPARLTHPPS